MPRELKIAAAGPEDLKNLAMGFQNGVSIAKNETETVFYVGQPTISMGFGH